MQNVNRSTGLLFAILAHIALSGCSGSSQADVSPPTEATLQRVTVGKPKRQPLQFSTTQPGRIEAFEQAPIHSKLSGYIEEVLVDLGDPVTKDQPLIRLAVPEMHDELRQKQAAVGQAKSEVDQAKSAVKAAAAARQTAEARVAQSDAGVLKANADYERAKAERARIGELAAAGSVTQKLVDESQNRLGAAEAARQEAAATVRSAKAAVAEASANVEKFEADMAACEARHKVAEADLARLNTLLKYLEIKAPFNGVVTSRNVDRGHYVQPSSAAGRPLLTVARIDRVRVFVDIPEAEAALVDLEDKVLVRVQALKAPDLDGQVTRTSWALDSANRSLRVEIDLENTAGRLRPGMYALAEIRLAERADALVVPRAALVREGRDVYVCCVDEGKVTRVPVTIGLSAGDDTEIVSGLAGTETIVMARAESLQAGQPVSPAAP